MSFNIQRSDRTRSGDNRNFDRPQMHEATCSKCGKSCLVPFKPTGNRPIFCKDCFKTEGGASIRRTEDRGSRTSVDRQMYDAICDKCGNRCQIPFPPRPGRQVYCSHCFEQIEKAEKNSTETPHIQEQLDAINIKLGKILQLLSTKTTPLDVPENVTQKTENQSKAAVAEEITKPQKQVAKTKKKVVSKKKTSPKTD